jgi:hypothetical protein
MKLGNGAQVMALIEQGEDVDAENRSGLTVLQYLAHEYCWDVYEVPHGERAERRERWRETVLPLWNESPRFVPVTSDGDCTVLNRQVDLMLDDLDLRRSKVPARREQYERMRAEERSSDGV